MRVAVQFFYIHVCFFSCFQQPIGLINNSCLQSLFLFVTPLFVCNQKHRESDGVESCLKAVHASCIAVHTTKEIVDTKVGHQHREECDEYIKVVCHRSMGRKESGAV